MTGRVVVQVRCHDAGRKVRWAARASAGGLSLSEWLRRAGDEQAALEESLERLERTEERSSVGDFCLGLRGLTRGGE